MKAAHMVIREAFSNKVITPGKTTNEDVVWWMRQRVVELGLGKWFQPSNHRRAPRPPAVYNPVVPPRPHPRGNHDPLAAARTAR
jgi:hypothetical protein